MLDTVIKNAILFLLIILILHFLINNVLVEMKITTKSNEMNDEIDEDDVINGYTGIDVDMNRPQPERETPPDKMKELYDYVFDKDSSKKLNKYFNVDNNIDKNNARDVQVKCSEELGGNKNFCMTTKPTQEELKGHYSNFNKVQCEGEIDQDKHVYILKKYDNEKSINGGKNDENEIMGFDGFDNVFDTY